MFRVREFQAFCLGVVFIVVVTKFSLNSIVENLTNLQYLKILKQVEEVRGQPYWNIFLVEQDIIWQGSIYKEATIPVEGKINWGASIDQNNPRWHYLHGHLQLLQGNLQLAKLEFEDYLASTHQRFIEGYFFLGLVQLAIGERNQAIDTWQKAPDISDFFLLYGTSELYDYENYLVAVKYLEISVELEPSLCEPPYHLGLAFAQLNKPEQALQIWSRENVNLVCEDNYFLGEIHYQRAKLLAAMGRLDKAIEAARQAVNADPTNLKYLVQLGNLLVSGEQDLDEAYEYFNSILSIDDQEMWGYIGLCNIERIRNNNLNALQWCKQSVFLYPENAYSNFYLGLVYLEMQDYHEAINWLQRAVANERNSANIWLRLGQTYQQIGDKEQALDAYQKALQIDPKNTSVQNHIDNLDP